jgi:hypothetical protein
MARIDHTACTHPRTPAGRRACRAGVTELVIPAVDYITRDMNRQRANAAAKARMDREYDARDAQIKMTGATARKLARHAAKADAMRIQPRRSGARVTGAFSSCVQAALHVGTGRCACGWDADAA